MKKNSAKIINDFLKRKNCISKGFWIHCLLLILFSFLLSIFSFPLSFDISIVAIFLGLGFSSLLAFFYYKATLVQQAEDDETCDDRLETSLKRNSKENSDDDSELSLEKEKRWHYVSFLRKTFEYTPFVMLAVFIFMRVGSYSAPYWVDFISVALWCLILVLSFVCSWFCADKRVKNHLSIEPQKSKKKNIFKVVLEWGDALLQAACLVLLINIFVFQLYEIPSESMVGEFMIKDRVFVFKTASGPKFPLSSVHFPQISSYDRGDIVVLRNPRYERTQQSEVKSFLSQLVYMLTFTSVNIDQLDENGNIKADPLVKRVVGLPGEQLVMADGILYRKTESMQDFEPVKDDWALWCPAKLSPEERKYVEFFPLSYLEPMSNFDNLSRSQLESIEISNYEKLLSLEEERRTFDIEEGKKLAQELISDFKKYWNPSSFGVEEPVSEEFLNILSLYNSKYEVLYNLKSSPNGLKWFSDFITSWEKAFSSNMDPYEKSMAQSNALLKLYFGKMLISDADFLSGIREVAVIKNGRTDNENKFLQYAKYIVHLNDQRNMPRFPENGYIPKEHYFMMGDNRFNSLDLRHSTETKKCLLAKSDPTSLFYYSNVSPQYLNADDILGTAIFKFWPLERAGFMKNYK